MTCLTLSLLLTLNVPDVISQKQPVVRTPLGEVAGYYMQTRGGRQISAFTAIPFAVPPLGDLRFKVSTGKLDIALFFNCLLNQINC